MHIFIINYEYPPLGGGGGQSSEQIAKELVKKGYEVSVMTSHYRGLPVVTTEGNYTIYRIQTLRRHREKSNVLEMLFFMISSIFRVCRLALKKKPQVVICFFSIPCGPAALLLKYRYKVPYVVSLRGGDVPGFLPEQLKYYHRISNWLTRLIWNQAKAVTTCSLGLADLARRFHPQREISIIPNGVDPEFYIDRFDQNQAKEVSHILRILTVGRLARQKQIERLIECAYRLVCQGFQEFRLVIVGDGPLRIDLESLAQKLGLLNRFVFFAGWVDHANLSRYYREADVFALSSDFEGMPNVVLEAMAASLAIVATEAPGTVELVENEVNGVLVIPRQLELFDKTFQRLHADKRLMQRFQKNSYQKAVSYSWKKTAEQYEALCLKALS